MPRKDEDFCAGAHCDYYKPLKGDCSYEGGCVFDDQAEENERLTAENSRLQERVKFLNGLYDGAERTNRNLNETFSTMVRSSDAELLKLRELLGKIGDFAPEIGQLIDALKLEWEPCNCWSEWDQSVRSRLTEFMEKIRAATGEESKAQAGKTHPLPVSPEGILVGPFVKVEPDKATN